MQNGNSPFGKLAERAASKQEMLLPSEPTTGAAARGGSRAHTTAVPGLEVRPHHLGWQRKPKHFSFDAHPVSAQLQKEKEKPHSERLLGICSTAVSLITRAA